MWYSLWSGFCLGLGFCLALLVVTQVDDFLKIAREAYNKRLLPGTRSMQPPTQQAPTPTTVTPPADPSPTPPTPESQPQQ